MHYPFIPLLEKHMHCMCFEGNTAICHIQSRVIVALFSFCLVLDSTKLRIITHCRCPSYIDLPTVCRFHKDPANPCCDIVECAELTTTPTQTTQPGPSNQAPNENPNPQTTTNITPTATPQSRCKSESALLHFD